ncbi:MAG: acyl-CoA desaturase [Myxococcales bacterium]|nr:acyl-CoA desaturase [Myxococcales bacterium]
MVRGSARSNRDASVSRWNGPAKDDYALLRSRVAALGLLDAQPRYYALVCARTALLFVLAWGTVVALRASVACVLAAPLLALASVQAVLLGHDACHGAVFRRSKWDQLLGLIAINLANGGSYTWWTASHNEHHARSNERDVDPDIEYPMFAFDHEQAAKKPSFARAVLVRQHWLAPLMFVGVAINLRVYCAVHLARGRAKPFELVAFALHWIAYVGAMFATLGLARGALVIALHQALFGAYLGAITVTNHWAMPMPANGSGLGFVAHQVETSRDLDGPSWVHFLWGGLDCQIEHHLFPTMARNRLLEARSIVRAFCGERGITHTQRSLFACYRDIYRAMHDVAMTVRAAKERGA